MRRKRMNKKIDWFGKPSKPGKLFTPIKFPTKKNTKNIKKSNLLWSQAKVRFPGLSPYKDSDKDGVVNMLDCRPFDKRRQDFGKFKRRGPRDEGAFTAAERFGSKNILRLKRVGSGRDRIVYALDKDKVIKIAKNPGGMRQNSAENDWNLNSSGIRPSFHEAGKDYVVMEKAKKLSKENKKKLKKVYSDVQSKLAYHRNPYDSVKEAATSEVLKKEFPKQEEDFDEILSYDIATSDITKPTSWGEDESGDIVLVDAGGMRRQDLLREHRITKMKSKQAELAYLNRAPVNTDDQKNEYRRLSNEKALLDAEIKEWDEVQRDRAAFRNKGEGDKLRNVRKNYAGYENSSPEQFESLEEETEE